VVVNISQCVAGSVEMGPTTRANQLKNAGGVVGLHSTVEGADTKLMHLLAHCKDPRAIRNMMNQSIAGEITID
jgi:L-asparaginase